MNTDHHWRHGDIVVLRGILKGRLWWACPMYVVQDTSELVATYWRAGTPIRAPINRPTVRDELDNHVETEDRQWVDHDVLSLHVPGAGHCIDLMWLAGTHKLRCWYVHLQEALRRSEIGFDTMDQMLDIVISPDRSDWYWKDEDEFSEAEAIGVYSHAQAAAIRAEGERVIGMLKANGAPFCDGWANWAPPVEWSIPAFPKGWEEASIY